MGCARGGAEQIELTATNVSLNNPGFTARPPCRRHVRQGLTELIRHAWVIARLCVQADAGQIDTVAFDMGRKTMTVSFVQAGKTAAGVQSYSVG